MSADRLAQVQPRVLYPVYYNKWEPELVSIHGTKQGAEAKVEHLLGPWCDDDDCFHGGDGHVWVGTPLEIQP